METPLPKIILGFDYGLRQIGVAVGQGFTKQARELCVLKAQDGIPNWQQIERLLKEWQPDAVVVGLPLNMDGSSSEMSKRAEKFARRLHGRFQATVYTQDERLTSYEAKEQYHAQGYKADYHKNPVDALAAALIIESWLENYSSTTESI